MAASHACRARLIVHLWHFIVLLAILPHVYAFSSFQRVASSLRSSNTTLPLNSTAIINSTTSALDDARRLLTAARAEIAAANLKRLQNPFGARYRHGNSSREKLGEVAAPPPLIRVNDTVAAAAAMVAEADAAAMLRNNTYSTDYSSLLALHQPEMAGKRKRQASSQSFWLENIEHQGGSPFAADAATYSTWRNVRSYGAKGDGVTDDTAAINAAIADGNRCAANCLSSTTKNALIYFPSGTYLVSSSIHALYGSQLVGNPLDLPIIKAAPWFAGLGVISANEYYPNGNGAAWYGAMGTSNFYREVRNFIIDISGVQFGAYVAALHWQVAQATNLQNIAVKMSTAANSDHQGMFAENGSGGFMSDLTFVGGIKGIYGGNQQYTVRNLKFNSVRIAAVHLIWTWIYAFHQLQITNCGIGISLLADSGNPATGSLLVVDSTFSNVQTAVTVENTGKPLGSSAVTFDNVEFDGVTTTLADRSGSTLVAKRSDNKVDLYTLGRTYQSDSPGGAFGLAIPKQGRRPSTLTTNATSAASKAGFPQDFYSARSKPQYEEIGAGGVLNVWSHGIMGDGATDVTSALRQLLKGDNGAHVLYFPGGTYMISDTVYVPPGTRIVGEAWASLMAYGSNFQDISRPRVMLQVGYQGEVGDVEISGMVFTSKGPTAGLIAVEWNLYGTSATSSGLWDTHWRIGGATGTDLTMNDCPIRAGVNSKCIAGTMLLHVTKWASIYMENTWGWVADHDNDDPVNNAQVSVYVARGFLFESQGPVMGYGTASEHSVLYQYALVGAKDVYLSIIQTETPYYQPVPAAPEPFAAHLDLPGDPNFEDCTAGSSSSAPCQEAWGLRIEDSSSITISGAGLYNWFNDYTQDCIGTQTCQEGILHISRSGEVRVHNLVTIGVTNMVSPGPASPSLATNALKLAVPAGDNINGMDHPGWSVVGLYAAFDAPFNDNTTTLVSGGVGWTAFGDSFSAGVAAGAVDPNSKECWRSANAWPLVLDADIGLDPGHPFGFLACTGAVLADVIGDLTQPEAGTSQVDAFLRDSPGQQIYATITIGGNDVDFVQLLVSCIYGYKLSGPGCSALADTAETVLRANFREKLAEAYINIIEASDLAKSFVGFKLAALGYPAFFNEVTDLCDSVSFDPITPPAPGAGTYVTKAVRARMNSLVRLMNTEIQEGVKLAVSKWPGVARVVYVDTDTAFQGHRFCEAWHTTPAKSHPDLWFFHIFGDDNVDGNSVGDLGARIPLDPSECDTALANPNANQGKFWACAFYRKIQDNPNFLPPDSFSNFTTEDFYTMPRDMAKSFHPTSRGHAAIKDAVKASIDANPLHPLFKVLIMFEGEAAAFQTLYNSLPHAGGDFRTIEYSSHNLRAVSCWISADVAAEVETRAGVLGVAFEYFQIRSDAGPAPGSAVAGSLRTSLNKTIARRQISQTDLSLRERGDFQNGEFWWQESISEPPEWGGEQYWSFLEGFLHDPRGGEGTHVYILDTGIQEQHSEFAAGTFGAGFKAQRLPDGSDAIGHGTAMASIVGGILAGVGRATLHNVRWTVGGKDDTPSAVDLWDALAWVLDQVRTNSQQGKAILNYAGFTTIDLFRNPHKPIDIVTMVTTDPIYHFIPRFKEEDIVFITSVNNQGETDENAPTPIGIPAWSYRSPARYAHDSEVGKDYLIVVGALNSNREHLRGSNWFPSLMGALAPGMNIWFADFQAQGSYTSNSGTSLATAIISGLVSTFIARADLNQDLFPDSKDGLFGGRVKKFLNIVATYHNAYSGRTINPQFDWVGTYNYLKCSAPAVSKSAKTRGLSSRLVGTRPTRDVRKNGQIVDTDQADCIGHDAPTLVGRGDYLGCVRSNVMQVEATSDQGELFNCYEKCSDDSYTYFAMELGHKCYCANSLVVPRFDSEQRQCDSVCRDKSSEVCGGAGWLSLYSNANNISPRTNRLEIWHETTHILSGEIYQWVGIVRTREANGSWSGDPSPCLQAVDVSLTDSSSGTAGQPTAVTFNPAPQDALSGCTYSGPDANGLPGILHCPGMADGVACQPLLGVSSTCTPIWDSFSDVFTPVFYCEW